MSVYDDVLGLAVDNHGYVTARETRSAGVDPTVLRKLAAVGRLERTAQGVYRVPVLASGPHAAYAEALAWTRGRGAISHESALDFLELCDVNPPLIHLTVPSTYTPRRMGGELYRVWRRTLDPAALMTHDGLAVFKPRESILDCLAYGTDPTLLLQACRTGRREGYLTDDELITLEAQVQTRSAVRNTQAGVASDDCAPSVGNETCYTAYSEAVTEQRIVADHRIMGGVPCIRGTRIPVATVVGLVAQGETAEQIVADYPQLAVEDVRAALEFAAVAVAERQLPLRTPA